MLIHFLWVFHTSKFMLIKDCSCSCLLKDACSFARTSPHTSRVRLFICLSIHRTVLIRFLYSTEKRTCRICVYLLLYLWRRCAIFKLCFFVCLCVWVQKLFIGECVSFFSTLLFEYLQQTLLLSIYFSVGFPYLQNDPM